MLRKEINELPELPLVLLESDMTKAACGPEGTETNSNRCISRFLPGRQDVADVMLLVAIAFAEGANSRTRPLVAIAG